MVRTKKQIVKEFQAITFMKMKGVNKRKKSELEKVLRFQKGLIRKR